MFSIQWSGQWFLFSCFLGFNVDTLPAYAKRSQRMVITARKWLWTEVLRSAQLMLVEWIGWLGQRLVCSYYLVAGSLPLFGATYHVIVIWASQIRMWSSVTRKVNHLDATWKMWECLFLLRSRVSKLWPIGLTWSTSYFVNKLFCLLVHSHVYLLSMVVFMQ